MSMDWDFRLTAYALGELEGAELIEMEAFVRENKDARDYVRDIRETAYTLSSELKSEPIPGTAPSGLAPTSIRRWWRFPVSHPYLSLATAGLAVLVFSLPLLKTALREKLTDMGTGSAISTLKPESPMLNEPAPAMTTASQDAAMSPQGYGGTTLELRAKGKFRSRHAEGSAPSASQVANTESYAHIQESDFLRVGDHPLSTFSIDVDTASYSIVRRFINSGTLPPPDAVRIEEMINYFGYGDEPPKDDKPFAVHVEQMRAPWKSEHRLVRIGLKSKAIDLDKRPRSNLVFLIDVSGSMFDENKLPLLKASLRQMVDKFNDNDRVAMVVYAGSTGLVLPPTSNKNEILAALEKLESGGSTNGGAGIQLAYKIAQENFIPGGTNRVILATDGDFNVGTTSEGELVRLIQEKARSKIFLSVIGFGSGNYKDAMMEKLADKGNGNYAYIDSLREAKKALVEQMGGTLVTVAKDVKIQVEFNPKFVSAYRLIGYENRRLQDEDFNDDTKDAGEIGAGHSVTALYEIVPVGVAMPTPQVDSLKYATTDKKTNLPLNDSDELMTVKLRFKPPEGDKSQRLDVPVKNDDGKGSADIKFAAAVAEFGMVLRQSKWKGSATYESALALAREGEKGNEYRKEFIELVGKAQAISRGPK